MGWLAELKLGKCPYCSVDNPNFTLNAGFITMADNGSNQRQWKDKGYNQGSLYKRIEDAIQNGLLTNEMGTWAHQVRLDANDQRHSDENADLPTIENAKQAVEFTKTLAEFLYVLPSKVNRGIAATQ